VPYNQSLAKIKVRNTEACNGSLEETMTGKTGMEKAVEQAVSGVLESHFPQLKQALVQRLLERLPQQSAPADASSSGENGARNLLKAVSGIHAGTTQREILRALLDNTVRYSGRAALFVIKSGAATGWQGRGFGSGEDPIKDFALDITVGLAARAMQSRMPFSGKAEEMDPQFLSRFGAPGQDEIFVLPLLLKEKVAALVYTDAGTDAGGQLDTAALELLVMASSAWLEVASVRKQAHREGGAESVAERAVGAAPVPPAQSFSDPFAAHAPKHVVPSPAPAEATAASAEAEPVSTAAAAAAPATDRFSHMPPEDAEVHRKAQRFARLLVDEIKLYNQVKVADGRKHKDLYDRLKEDIEKSRATYQKRYGNTVASGADYFSHELIRSLAEDDSSIMGANFRR
jgi:hypothetical protein